MKGPLIHGCYDKDTLRTLKEIGIQRFGFDLRGRSPNLVPYHALKEMLKDLSGESPLLIFENDRASTVSSFIDLLGGPKNLVLEFRDTTGADFYDSFRLPYFWMFNPQADWQKIFHSRHLKGVLLPLSYQDFYRSHPEFWDRIEKRGLEVFLHATHFSEVQRIQKNGDLLLSVDLSREVEKGFRSIDQERLKKEVLEFC
jgi:hypothetical protein